MSKSFFGVTVLDDFSTEIYPGQVHALLGHNGSGKSTFVKVLAGFHLPDADPPSRIEIDGNPLRPGDPESSRTLGLRFVHQELGLVGDLTVLENLRLGLSDYQTGFGARINWRDERRRAEAALARVGLDVSPEMRFRDLTAIAQTEVAIARALQEEANARVLILDEVTAALPDSEVRKLFDVVRRVRELGVAVLYVTHRLDEVYELADEVTVLRTGRIVGRGSTAELTRRSVIDLIVGGSASSTKNRVSSQSNSEGAVALEVRSLSGGDIEGLSYSVRAGEVVGVAGLVGSGVHDVARILNGQLRARSGEVLVEGRSFSRISPSAASKRGLVVLPARRSDKLIQEMTVKENVTLTSVGRFFRNGLFRWNEERAEATRLTSAYNIRCSSIEAPVRTLSGGNQQKVAVARALQSRPRVLALDEPTQGVDVGGKDEVFALLRKAAGDGIAVLVCSSDVEELEEICDRVLVMRSGRLAAELNKGEITHESILRESYGS